MVLFDGLDGWLVVLRGAALDAGSGCGASSSYEAERSRWSRGLRDFPVMTWWCE